MSKIIQLKEARLMGLSRYYTGKPCKFGHISERYTSTSQCVMCASGTNADKFREVQVPIALAEYVTAFVDMAALVPASYRMRCQTDEKHNLWIDGEWVGNFMTRGLLDMFMWSWLLRESEDEVRRIPKHLIGGRIYRQEEVTKNLVRPDIHIPLPPERFEGGE